VFPDLKVWVAIFNMYFGSVNIFRPLVSANIRDFQTHKYSGFYYGVGRKNGRGDGVERQEIHGIDNNKNLQNRIKIWLSY
jgi:hypothetical protein